MQISRHRLNTALFSIVFLGITASSAAANVASVTYKPYVQPGDASVFGPKDQMVVAWQTDASVPTPNNYVVEFGKTALYGGTATTQGRVVDNYLSADPALPIPPAAPGPRSNYYALLANLDYDTVYFYRVSGPGMPPGGFASSFRSRTKTGQMSFQVMGDEGFFPPDPAHPPYLANFEARIVHLMNNVQSLSLPGVPALPRPNLALNTGDNVYSEGSEGNYRDYWMPVWNSDSDSNETGAPFIRSVPYYIVAGNHDVGGSGDFVNLLAADSAGRFTGNLEGGDALQYFNNYYFPLNGPVGADVQYVFNGDTRTPNGFYFRYKGVDYSSPAAIEAFRASTTVDTGQGAKRQIDRMHNFSFDYGNIHFVFLDANPHLFNALLDYTPTYKKSPSNFPDYPTLLRNWLINDLDSSNQLWKIVVYHQPAFSSGNGTLRNNQMRRIAKVLEDHGVNLVFNGHEHNYQRTLPIRALDRVAEAPTTLSSPAVAIDRGFDGVLNTIPDGVIYLVEGAGGDRDFDNNLPQPRGQGPVADQEDSASGVFTYAPGQTFPIGPASWLDTNLTNVQMSPFFPNAGAGPKITAKFKAKLFSFAQVLVNDNTLTLYQISEPLLSTSSAGPVNPAPFGTDATGNPVNDPIPNTLVNPATGQVVTPPANGNSALLDRFTVTKPDVTATLTTSLSAPPAAIADGALVYTVSITNNGAFALNGVQAVITLPPGVDFADMPQANTTLQGNDVVVTIGRISPGEQRIVQVKGRVSSAAAAGATLSGAATLRSGTALPLTLNSIDTTIASVEPAPMP